MTEHGRDWTDSTADHVQEGSMTFDVWIYARTLGGRTIIVRQLPPPPLASAPVWWTMICAGGMTTHQVGMVLVDLNTDRVAWADLDPALQAEVYAAAGTGWVWDGVEHYFDPVEDAWVPGP